MFGSVAIIAGIATLPLPEAMNKPLPQTTSEVYTIYYNKSKTPTVKL